MDNPHDWFSLGEDRAYKLNVHGPATSQEIIDKRLARLAEARNNFDLETSQWLQE